MKFHWITDKGKVYHTVEVPIGQKLVGLTHKNTRPDYVTISSEESAFLFNEEGYDKATAYFRVTLWNALKDSHLAKSNIYVERVI